MRGRKEEGLKKGRGNENNRAKGKLEGKKRPRFLFFFLAVPLGKDGKFRPQGRRKYESVAQEK